jgi:hypothetical protein
MFEPVLAARPTGEFRSRRVNERPLASPPTAGKTDLSEQTRQDIKILQDRTRVYYYPIPREFMFGLTVEERDELVAICNRFRTMKHSSVMPLAFTEHGVAMLASVLRSERAIKMSIIIVKTFVRLREIMSVHKEFAYKLKELERKIEKHDADIKDIFEAIRQLMRVPDEHRKITGFAAK